MDDKALKKLIQTQIAPLLIGIRNDLEANKHSVDELAKEVKKKSKLEYELEIDNNDLKGKDGSTPIADKDYPAFQTVKNWVTKSMPKKGVDYWTDKEIKTLVKQITKLVPPGKDGQVDYTKVKRYIDKNEDKIKGYMQVRNDKMKSYVDKVTAKLFEYVKAQESPELTALEIRDKLETLTGSQRLDAKYIKNLDKYISSFVIATTGGSGGNGGDMRNPMTILGDTIYGGVSGTPTRLAGNTTTALKVLTQRGDGSVSSAPDWQALPTVGNNVYMFANVASDIATYYDAVSLSGFTPTTLGDISTAGVSTTPTLLGVFATEPNNPNVTAIPVGLFTVHYETEKVAGSNNYYTYAEIYKRTAGGTETLLLTTDSSSESASNNELQNTVVAYNSSVKYLNATDRLVVKIYGVMLSSTATIHLHFDDNTDARLEVPSLGGSGGGTWGSITGTLSDQTDLQNALDAKAPLASPTFTGTVTTPALNISGQTASRVAIFDASKNVVSADTATYPTLTELSYVKGATSSIQTQLNAKLNKTDYKGGFGVIIDAGAGNSIDAGTTVKLKATKSFQPTEWYLFGDNVTDIELDVWRNASSFPVFSSDSICNSVYPTIISAGSYAEGDASTWDAIDIEDYLVISVKSVTGTTGKITLQVRGTNIV